jgi:hypothetical protein
MERDDFRGVCAADRRPHLESEGFGETTGIDSPYGQPHREDPQVVEDREETLTAATLQIGYGVSTGPAARTPAESPHSPDAPMARET